MKVGESDVTHQLDSLGVLGHMLGTTCLHACRAMVEGRLKNHPSPAAKTAALDAIQRDWARTNIERAGVRVHLESATKLEPGQRFILVSNHLSLSDVPVLIHGMPLSIRFVAKKELSYVPFLGSGMESAGHIVIDRSRGKEAYALMRKAVDEAGTTVAIFPEGTRSRDGQLLPFKAGAFHLAVETRLPVLPVSLIGTRSVMAPDSSLVKWGVDVTIRVGRPVESGTLGADELRTRVRTIIESMMAT